LAGNVSDWTAFEAISIDNEKPVITNFIDPKGRWFNYPVPLSVSGTDQYSGVRTGYTGRDQLAEILCDRSRGEQVGDHREIKLLFFR
ncbi:MAG: hypothetical protein J5767_14880, partial [Paludibacteraceae bacterium]|nr:hypothetical protein [Paludibacteraceae bacterium]